MRIRVLVVHANDALRADLRGAMTADPRFVPVGEAPEARHTVELAEAHRPDVIVTELQSTDRVAVLAALRLQRLGNRARQVVLTAGGDHTMLFDMVRAGATCCVLEDDGVDAILDAVAKAAVGESVLSPTVASAVLEEFRRMASLVPPAASYQSLGLTEREGAVLRLLAHGISNRGIARRLSLAEGTVKNHLSAIYRKLGTRDRTEAALLARRHNLG